MNKSVKLYNGTQKSKQRREKVILRLEEQLKSGTKTLSNLLHKALGGTKVIGLEDADVKRIKKEVSTLKTRI